jgi:hypothetical protein
LGASELSSIRRRSGALFLVAVALFSTFTFWSAATLQIIKAEPTEVKNVILIGWDGVQRNHLFELLNGGNLSNLKSFVKEGTIANITVMDHRTDTKAGWTQILTGYKWWRTGVFNNAYRRVTPFLKGLKATLEKAKW